VAVGVGDETSRLLAWPPRRPEEIHALIAAAVNDGDLDAFIALHEERATNDRPDRARRCPNRFAVC
jgi:hypothetical protein